MSRSNEVTVIVSRKDVEKIVFKELTEYLEDMADALKNAHTSSLPVHSFDLAEEVKELKKDIKAIKRIRSYYNV